MIMKSEDTEGGQNDRRNPGRRGYRAHDGRGALDCALVATLAAFMITFAHLIPADYPAGHSLSACHSGRTGFSSVHPERLPG